MSPSHPLDAITLADLRGRGSTKWRRYPAEVIPLWIADMDFPVARSVRRRLMEAVARSDLGYPPEDDESDLRSSASSWLGRHTGWSPDPSLITIVPDTVRGLEIAILAFSEPGAPVVVNTPIYPPFLAVVRDTGRSVVDVPMRRAHGRWMLDLDELEQAFRDGARLHLLCHPHNPTGAVLTPGELDRIADLAERYDVIVASDEIHGLLAHPGVEYAPLASRSDAAASRTVIITGASKAYNVAGTRCSLIVCGSRQLHDAVRSLPARTRKGVSILGVAASLGAFDPHADAWLDDVRSYLRATRDEALARVSAIAGLDAVRPQATYFLWTEVAGGPADVAPARWILDRARVAVSDGCSFGEGWDRFVRISLATPRPVLAQALDRIAGAW